MAIPEYELDRHTPVPLYYQLKQMILAQIKDGTLQTGDMLPTELELCQRYGVSRQTIRQALGELVFEGYLHRHKGRGTFAVSYTHLGKKKQAVKNNGYPLLFTACHGADNQI